MKERNSTNCNCNHSNCKTSCDCENELLNKSTTSDKCHDDECHDDCCCGETCHDDECHDDCCGSKKGSNKNKVHVDIGCSCCDHDCDDEDNDNSTKKEIIRLIIAGTVFIIGLILSHFNLPQFVVMAVFAVCLVVSGMSVYTKAFKNILKGKVFDENFLMSVASISAFCIGQFSESALVLLFNQIGELLENVATDKSKKSITDLMDLRPDYANLVKNGKVSKVSPEKVKIGDIIEILPGEKIPLDGEIVEGSSLINTSGLTGEAVPRRFSMGDEIKSGYVNTDSILKVKVTKLFCESTVSKIIELVQHSVSKKAKTESFITKFAKVYTPIVTISALLLALIPPIFFGGTLTDWIYRGVIFLVVSCPCALVVSVPLTYFAGIGAASFNGILVKGGNYLEALSKAKTVVFDKTGTLTKGVFEVTEINNEQNITKEKFLNLAATAQILSTHPIAKSIVAASDIKNDREKIKDFQEIAGMGIIATTDFGKIVEGNSKLMERENISYKKSNSNGTIVYVALDGVYLGNLVISDIIKSHAKESIQNFKHQGILKTYMLTGDNKKTAKTVANEISIDEVYSELLPEDKVKNLEKAINDNSGTCVFVGDGINDAPVLARADVGIAMGGIGSDAAVEAADVVIMDDNPMKISTAIKISKYVKLVVLVNIIFALTVKFAVLILGAFGYANILEAVFADTGVTLIAVLNSLTVLIKRKHFN